MRAQEQALRRQIRCAVGPRSAAPPPQPQPPPLQRPLPPQPPPLQRPLPPPTGCSRPVPATGKHPAQRQPWRTATRRISTFGGRPSRMRRRRGRGSTERCDGAPAWQGTAPLPCAAAGLSGLASQNQVLTRVCSLVPSMQEVRDAAATRALPLHKQVRRCGARGAGCCGAQKTPVGWLDRLGSPLLTALPLPTNRKRIATLAVHLHRR